MVDTSLPTLYHLESPGADGPEGRVHAARELATGRACRLTVAREGDASHLLLRQAHRAEAALAHPQLAAALALGQAEDGTWWRTQAGVCLVSGRPDPTVLRNWVAGWLGGLAHLHAAG